MLVTTGTLVIANNRKEARRDLLSPSCAGCRLAVCASKLAPMGTSGAWSKLGASVTARRIKIGYPTQAAFAGGSGISPRLINEIENGRRKSYRASTLVALEAALWWKEGSVMDILQGEGPTELTIPDSEPQPEPVVTSLGEVDDAELVARLNEIAAEVSRRLSTRGQRSATAAGQPPVRDPSVFNPDTDTRLSLDPPPDVSGIFDPDNPEKRGDQRGSETG